MVEGGGVWLAPSSLCRLCLTWAWVASTDPASHLNANVCLAKYPLLILLASWGNQEISPSMEHLHFSISVPLSPPHVLT
jgi:hypothetical protein